MLNWPPLLIVWAMFTIQPVTISVYPRFAMPPATFRITVLVPRHLENRKLCYAVTGPEEKRSCLSLDGWQARRSWTVYWDLRTAGEYEATATLTRMVEGREQRFVESQPFRVLGVEP